MKPELCSVTRTFTARHAHTGILSEETFAKGERLIVYDNDGVHVTFVRADDQKKSQPFITTAQDIEDNTA